MSITHAELADLVLAEPAVEPSTVDEPATVATAEPSTAEPSTHDAGGADAGGTPPQLPAAADADVALKSKGAQHPGGADRSSSRTAGRRGRARGRGARRTATEPAKLNDAEK
jgi:hypothetical protein